MKARHISTATTPEEFMICLQEMTLEAAANKEHWTVTEMGVIAATIAMLLDNRDEYYEKMAKWKEEFPDGKW